MGYHFCETIAADSGLATVVMVRKTSDYYYGMKVELIQHISGEAVADTFTVWGDNGALCRLYTGWADGDTIILALHHTDMMGNVIMAGYPPDLEQPGDYHISVCGVYALDVENGMVTGSINAQGMQSMPLAQFLQQPCLAVVGTENWQETEFSIYPNPVKDRVQLSIESDESHHISIVSSEGRTVFRQMNFVPGNALDVQDLQPGLYHLVIWNEKEKITRKFIKL
jgi:hypothetical protein